MMGSFGVIPSPTLVSKMTTHTHTHTHTHIQGIGWKIKRHSVKYLVIKVSVNESNSYRPAKSQEWEL